VSVVALITWILTALGGAVLLARWLGGGGLRDRAAGASRFPPGLIFGHFLLAAVGLVLWIVYVAVDAEALTWVAFVILLVVALLGFTMFARWLQGRRTGVAAGEGTSVGAGGAPEQQFPVPIVALHGLLAAVTLVLVLLVALGVGGD
jgi:hypothetical protein